MEHNPWRTISSKTIHSTPWLHVNVHEVLTPANTPSQYTTINFTGVAVGVIALDKDYNTWIVGQWRYPIERYSWEIPEGGANKTEDPLEAAKRELLEETGITAKKWTPLMEFYVSNSATDEHAFLFIAQDLDFAPPKPDLDEDLKQLKIPFSELVEKVMSGEIVDSISISAILKTHLLIQNGEL